jgi:proline iminopeptidase
MMVNKNTSLMKSLSFLLLLFIAINTNAQKYPNSLTDGKYVKVNGANLYVVTVGKGDPLILIAGGPGGTHFGLRRFDSLAGRHMLIYFDAFGRGKSDTAKDVKEYTIERDIEDIEGLRVALHLDKINVLGHSYGSVVAQGYAVKYPQHVKHLVLANGFHSFIMWQTNDDNSNHEIKTNYPEVWDTLMKIRAQGYVSSDKLHQDIYGRIPYGFLYAYNPDNFISRGKSGYPGSNNKLYYQMVGKDGDFIVGNDIGNFDFRTKLKDLKMPILIYGGRYDRVAVPSMMVIYKQYCPQAQFVMFEHSGHNPQVEEPGKLFPLLDEFLRK